MTDLKSLKLNAQDKKRAIKCLNILKKEKLNEPTRNAVKQRFRYELLRITHFQLCKDYLNSPVFTDEIDKFIYRQFSNYYSSFSIENTIWLLHENGYFNINSLGVRHRLCKILQGPIKDKTDKVIFELYIYGYNSKRMERELVNRDCISLKARAIQYRIEKILKQANLNPIRFNK